MSYPPRKRRPPFVTLPRHKRSHEVIRLNGIHACPTDAALTIDAWDQS